MKLKNRKKISIMILAAFILVVVSTLIYFNSTSQKEENIIDKAKKTSGKAADNIPRKKDFLDTAKELIDNGHEMAYNVPQKVDIIDDIAKASGKAISDMPGKTDLNDKEETK